MISVNLEGQHVFGTYRLKGKLLEIALDQAVSEMIKAGYAAPMVDTAVMYRNNAQVLKCMCKYPNVMVGSKIKHSGDVAKSELKGLVETFGDRLHRVLLHRHMPTENFDMLLEAKREGLIKEVGVSNYSVSQLEELLHKCNGKPDVVQNEFHPFLRTGVPQFCKLHGIKFEAHSIMTCLEEYQTLPAEWGLTPAQIAMAYAFQVGGGGVCFSTINFHHLIEDLNVQTLSPAQLQTMSQLVDKVQHARYKGADNHCLLPGNPSADLALLHGSEADAVCSAILPRLLSDIRALHEGGTPSNLAFTIPERPVANPIMAALAALVFNNTAPPPTARDERTDTLSRVHRLSHLLKRIRKRAGAAADAARAAALRGQTCKAAGAAVENPAALPVDIPAAAAFRPVIAALHAECR